MIGIIASFFAGVFATLGWIFWDDVRRAAKRLDVRAPRPWHTITHAEGSTELTGQIEGQMGALCSALLCRAAEDPSLTSGITMNTKVRMDTYKVFVSWKMVFTVEPKQETKTT